jgi:hypothetical protein
MISRAEAAKQVKRLSGLPGFPDSDEAAEVLVDVMMTAQSVTAAAVFTTAWLYEEGTAPTPAHVYHHFHPRKDEQLTSNPPASSRNCPFCNGSGWTIVERADQTTAARACRCRLTPVA